MADAVIVVEGGDGDQDGAGAGTGSAPAPPAYVTPGELDARMELLEKNIGDRVSEAFEQAWKAREIAEQAADEAAVATAVAADAAASADESDDDDTVGATGEAIAVEQDDTPKPPEKRSAAPKKVSPSATPRRRSYGAASLFGRR